MKAILVIDMPKECYDCQLMTDNMYCKGFAPYYKEDGTHITKMCVEDNVMYGDKHSNCPLKPMPEKRDYELKDDHPYNTAEILAYTYGLAVGRNLSIDEILGE